MQGNVVQRLFAAAVLVRKTDMVKVDAAVGDDGVGPWPAGPGRGLAVSTSAMRSALAVLIEIITNTIESIIRLISTLIT